MPGREVVLEVGEQLRELRREIVGSNLAAVALEREHRLRIATRRAAEAQIDPARVEAAKRGEVLGHLQRAVCGSITPPLPTLIVAVCAPIAAIRTSGLAPAIMAWPWCSATQ